MAAMARTADIQGPVTPDTGAAICQCLVSKGWCLIDMPALPAHGEAMTQAASLHYTSLPLEVTAEYLGQDGRGKVAPLEMDSLGSAEQSGGIEMYVALINQLCDVVELETDAALGFEAAQTTPMVVMPYGSLSEAASMRPSHLTEGDVQSGSVRGHIDFIRRRKLCVIYWLETEGDDVRLSAEAKSGFGWSKAQVQAQRNRVLIFNCDQITYSHVPVGKKSVRLMTWMLEASRRIETIASRAASREREFLDVLQGPRMPVGSRVHAMSMALRMNCSVDSTASFLSACAGGCDGFVEFSEFRWDVELYSTTGGEKAEGKSYVRHAAFLDMDVLTGFDHDLFGYTAEESNFIPPAQRNGLEVSYEALTAAGYNKDTLKGQYIGLYVGDAGQASIFARGKTETFLPEFYMDGRTSASNGVTASRICFNLGLRGPTASVDTACSAALTAFTVAATTMRTLSSQQAKVSIGKPMREALCMGNSHFLNVNVFIGLCAANMLSPDGRCFTFDDSANGYARGEAVDALFLRFSNSPQDHRDQLACIAGAQANQDGRSASLTAPNGPSQQIVIRNSLNEAGTHPSEVSTSECHGTGTALGDPIEVGALRGVMKGERSLPLLLGSSKTNIGHGEACAGLAGLCKLIGTLQSGIGAPNIHLWSLNAHLDVEGFPDCCMSEVCEVPLAHSNTGVSSFGLGGTNARGDLWGECAYITRQPQLVRELQSKTLRAKAICPMTLGPIDSVSGEPLGDDEDHCDAIRTMPWYYDLSGFVYSRYGDYRYRAQPFEERNTDASKAHKLFLCSSTSGWKDLEPMTKLPDGSFSAKLTVGEARRELFYLCVDGKRDAAFFPLLHKANSTTWAQGPEKNVDSKYWLVDGRSTGIFASEGITYDIRFRWGAALKLVEFKTADVPSSSAPGRPYSITGSLTAYVMTPMTLAPRSTDLWESTLQIGSTGEEDFCFARDGDAAQMIYPSRSLASSSSTPARGPDDLSNGKRWRLAGEVGAVCKISLQVAEGRIAVKAQVASASFRMWRSIDTSAQFEFFVAGTLTDGALEPMVMVGVGRFQIVLPVEWRQTFRILQDADPGVGLVPGLPDARSAEAIVHGPNRLDQLPAHDWLVTAPAAPGSCVDITLDLAQLDRRKWVTFKVIEKLAITE